MRLEELRAAAETSGLALRGGFRPTEAERAGPLAGAGSVILLGFIGAQQWPAFAGSPEAADGAAHPLDRWSRRIIAALADRFAAKPLFPFEGPPYWPFQAWARRAEPLFPSPLGMLIHPCFGLWHSYRGALAFAGDMDVPPPPSAESPCASCAEKPCLSACPVGAFSTAGYDVDGCAAYLKEPRPCTEAGCLARRACPVGGEFAQAPEQAAFHMRAFLAARS